MRGSRAKALRKLARAHSKGMPARRLLGKNHTLPALDAKGNPIRVTRIQAVNDPKSTRGIYRILKLGAGAHRTVDLLKGEQKNGTEI